MFACNLEIYTAIGNFFYKKDNLKEKQILVSSGLFLTIFFSIIVILLLILNEKLVLNYFFNSLKYHYEFKISLIWLFIAAIGTYLGVIPRYTNQQKTFVLISAISLLIRAGSTVFFILTLNTGIVGVIYGQIIGASFSLVFNAWITKKYIVSHFQWSEIKSIVHFAFPIVPGVLLIGLWQPFSRSLISKFYSMEDVGLLSFAVRITSVLEIANYGIRYAWLPMLFENHEKENFKTEVTKISKLVGVLAFTAAIALTLLSPEIAKYIGTKEYQESSILIGFLAFSSVFEILRNVRGFGPFILKKTYLLTLAEIGGICLGLLFFILFSSKLGLFGIGFLFLVPSFFKYISLSIYTGKAIGVKFFYVTEIFFYVSIAISMFLVYLNESIIARGTFMILIIGYFLYTLIGVINNERKPL